MPESVCSHPGRDQKKAFTNPCVRLETEARGVGRSYLFTMLLSALTQHVGCFRHVDLDNPYPPWEFLCTPGSSVHLISYSKGLGSSPELTVSLAVCQCGELIKEVKWEPEGRGKRGTRQRINYKEEGQGSKVRLGNRMPEREENRDWRTIQGLPLDHPDLKTLKARACSQGEKTAAETIEAMHWVLEPEGHCWDPPTGA